jgi:hypothetical protein
MLYSVEVRNSSPSIHLAAIKVPIKKQETKDQGKIINTQYPEGDYRRYNPKFRDPKQQAQEAPESQEPPHMVIFIRAFFTYDDYFNPAKKNQGISAYH